MGHNDNRGNTPTTTSIDRDRRRRNRELREDALSDAADATGDGGEPDVWVPHPTDIRPNRYLRLDVPNFNGADKEEEQMTSYLRLGTIEDVNLAGNPYAPKATGEDLASAVWSFLDDERKRDGCPDFVSVDDRKAETARLHYKGGWRDHSDGNRISTTRGDKVEVIRGSYKLVVLGRTDDTWGGTGWDVSGGHTEGVGGKSSIEWVKTFDGTWRSVETSEKGDTDTTQHGNSVSRTFGDIMDSTTGSEDETRPWFDAEGKPAKVPASNPVITDRTWAKRIESYTGSPARPVPLVKNETYAESMVSKTDVSSMSDETTVSGTMTTTTKAGEMTDTTIAGHMTSITLADMMNLTQGRNTQITIGPQENVTIGTMIDLTLSAMLQVCVSGSISVNLGPKADYSFPDTFSLSPSRNEVSANRISVSGVDSTVAGVFRVTAGVILLGG